MVHAESPVNIFSCYAPKDRKLFDELQTHLSPLNDTIPIKNWHDGEVLPGTVLKEAIATQLDEADVILLLISPNFIASADCYKNQLERALERAKKEEAFVIPILVRPVHLEKTPFSRLKKLPDGEKPVTRWSNRDDAWKNVVEGISRVITAFLENQASKIPDLAPPSPLFSKEINTDSLLGGGISMFTRRLLSRRLIQANQSGGKQSL